MFIEDHQATFTFQVSHETCYTQMWRYLHKHVDVIRAAFRFYDPYTFPFTYFPQYFPYIRLDLFVNDLAAVLRRKYDMIFVSVLRSVYKELHADRETGC